MMQFRHAVGRSLRMHRELRGISLLEMSTQSGYAGVSGWSRVETGDTIATVEHAYAAALVMEVPAHQVLKLAEELLKAVNAAEREAPRG